ncbi:MAG: LapA family protein [Clostridia bacterium]|nr:LapA family protein [Clostridia bacterium]
MKMQVYLIMALVFALVVAVFAVQNAIAVDIQFLFWGLPRVPLSLVILASVVSGAVIVFVVGIMHQIQMTMRIRELSAKNGQLEKTLDELKAKLAKDTAKPDPVIGQAPGNQPSDQSKSVSKKECD